MEPKQHPVWKPFHAKLSGKTDWSESKIELLWELFFHGMKLQKERMAENASKAKKTPNEYYDAIAKELQDKLIVAKGPMALWSGGYGVSEYARYKGYTTLESTLLGGAFDRLFEDHLEKNGVEWGVIAPLWNAISRKYVAMGKSAVAVFIRIHEPNSVLLREEMPTVAGNHSHKVETLAALEDLEYEGLTWHVVFGEGSTESLRELNDKLELVHNYSFPTLLAARLVLKKYLAKQSPRNHDANNMNSELQQRHQKDLAEYKINLKKWESAGKPPGQKPKKPEMPVWNRAAAGMKID